VQLLAAVIVILGMGMRIVQERIEPGTIRSMRSRVEGDK
jgi:hypothetical protein